MPDIIQTCRITGESFIVNEWEQDFLKKMGVPLPTLCIDERHRRRLSFRNERSIYNSKCALTGEPMISMFAPDSEYKGISQEIWWSDQWDPRDFGRGFDFNRPFFEQFDELQKDVYHIGLLNRQGENSEYCNLSISNKNCYLVFGGDYGQDCMHSIFSMHCTDCLDAYWVNKSELTYDSIDCHRCYNVKYSQNSESCGESSFLYGCKNLKKCFGCVNLHGKKYHIFNKPVSPEEYEATLAKYKLDTWSGVQHMKQEFEKFKLGFPHRGNRIVNSENCDGDDIFDAKNCHNCFDIEGPAEDFKDVIFGGWEAKDLLSCTHAGFKAELFYEMAGCIEGTNCAFCAFSWGSNEVMYCEMVMNSDHLFGCSNMKKSKYCILNKQYAKEEYFKLKARIIEHMKNTGEFGEFFPSSISIFGYDETAAQDFFPLTKDEALSKGYKWRGEELREIGSGSEIPDAIDDTTDDLCNLTLICKKSGRPYKIVPKELKFYRKMGIPVPHYAPETRNRLRIAQRNPRLFWDRDCGKCSASMKTSYAPERPETVWCEKCYLAEVY